MRATDKKAGSLILWRFTDGKIGHDSQSRGLIQALARYRPCRIYEVPAVSLLRSLSGILRRNFTEAAGLPDPFFLIGAGHGTHAAMLSARHARGGKIILLMKPTLPVRWFDLCLIPEHDTAANHSNVIRTRGVLNNLKAAPPGSPDQGLILLGGISRHYQWDEPGLLRQIQTLVARGLQWKMTDSRRTPESTRKLLARLARANIEYVPSETSGSEWLRNHFQHCGTVWVTPDSVSMVHEALSSGASVGLLHLESRGNNRVNGAIQRLISSGFLTTFDDWCRGQPLTPPPTPLNEADRCARLILEHFGQSRDPGHSAEN